MQNLSFVDFMLRARANPILAKKSAFQMYRSYQRAQMRSRWLNVLLYGRYN